MLEVILWVLVILSFTITTFYIYKYYQLLKFSEITDNFIEDLVKENISLRKKINMEYTIDDVVMEEE